MEQRILVCFKVTRTRYMRLVYSYTQIQVNYLLLSFPVEPSKAILDKTSIKNSWGFRFHRQ